VDEAIFCRETFRPKSYLYIRIFSKKKVIKHTKKVEEIKKHPATTNITSRYQTFMQPYILSKNTSDRMKSNHGLETANYQSLLQQDLEFTKWYQIMLEDEISKFTPESKAHKALGDFLDYLHQQSSSVEASSVLETFMQPSVEERSNPPTSRASNQKETPDVPATTGGFMEWLFGGQK
jgi:hypothetical protein